MAFHDVPAQQYAPWTVPYGEHGCVVIEDGPLYYWQSHAIYSKPASMSEERWQEVREQQDELLAERRHRYYVGILERRDGYIRAEAQRWDNFEQIVSPRLYTSEEEAIEWLLWCIERFKEGCSGYYGRVSYSARYHGDKRWIFADMDHVGKLFSKPQWILLDDWWDQHEAGMLYRYHDFSIERLDYQGNIVRRWPLAWSEKVTQGFDSTKPEVMFTLDVSYGSARAAAEAFAYQFHEGEIETWSPRSGVTGESVYFTTTKLPYLLNIWSKLEYVKREHVPTCYEVRAIGMTSIENDTDFVYYHQDHT